MPLLGCGTASSGDSGVLALLADLQDAARVPGQELRPHLVLERDVRHVGKPIIVSTIPIPDGIAMLDLLASRFARLLRNLESDGALVTAPRPRSG
jgi:hypothetical protein